VSMSVSSDGLTGDTACDILLITTGEADCSVIASVVESIGLNMFFYKKKTETVEKKSRKPILLKQGQLVRLSVENRNSGQKKSNPSARSSARIPTVV
jgi:hypothetical protein